MPTPQPTKSRAKSIGDAGRSLGRWQVIEAIDWLTLWAISLGICAIVLAGLAFYGGGDSAGAAIILLGAAAIIALVLRTTSAPGKRS